MNSDEMLHRIFEHVDEGDVDKAVGASLRLARHVGDYINTALFLRELIDDRNAIARVLLDDMGHLKKEAQTYVFEESRERWLISRTLPFSMSADESDTEEKVFVVPVGQFASELDQCERQIADLTVPSSMGEYDSAAFTDRYANMKGQFRLRIRAINAIKSRILAHCLFFATQIERQIAAQQKSRSFLESAQNEVQNYFRTRSADVYEKLQKANDLVDSNSKEDCALLLTEIRRVIKSVSDYFYPATTEPVQCSDGAKRVLGDDQYLNRLQEFVNTRFTRSTSTDLLRAELNYLLVFARKLNDIASKGVHADVSILEAKQGFLGLYMFLYNVCQRLEIEGL